MFQSIFNAEGKNAQIIHFLFRNPIFDMISNMATTSISYDKRYKVFLYWDERRNDEGRKPKTGIQMG